ncbi:MAG: GC-type dockerin domain-anchored protein [Phycisphaerales bacterium]
MVFKLVAAAALVASAVSSNALAQMSMDKSVIGAGGETSVGGNITLTGTIAQPITGPADDGGPTSICSGFWCVVTVACGPADVATLGGTPGPDAQLTVDDLVYFLNCFFGNILAVADIAQQGGAPVPDGQLTVDDLVLYLQLFFAGCTN